MFFFTLRTTIVLTIAVLIVVAVTLYINRAPMYPAVLHGATLETVSRLYPTICYYGWWYRNGLYCTLEITRNTEYIIRASVRFKDRRVSRVRYYNYVWRDGIAGYTSCGGY